MQIPLNNYYIVECYLYLATLSIREVSSVLILAFGDLYRNDILLYLIEGDISLWKMTQKLTNCIVQRQNIRHENDKTGSVFPGWE